MRLPLCVCLLAAGLPAQTSREAAGKIWWSHVQFLADDKLEGRNVGSKGFEAAAGYVISQFEKAGLAPGAGASYSQPVDFTRVALDEAASRVTLIRDGLEQPVKLGDEALLGVAPRVADVEAPLVFVGYGLDIPEANYSDLKDPSLRGAIAVYLTGGPSTIPGALRSHYSSADERGKALRAAGVVGTISMANPHTMEIPWTRQIGNRLQARMSLADPALATSSGRFSATWNGAKSTALFEGSGHTIDDILDAAEHDRPLPHFPLKGKLRAHVATSVETIPSRNLIGVRAGSDARLKNEFVIVSAHLDHLGVGQPVNGDAIFNGAMDNASGIASLIEIARALQSAKVTTKRSIAFLAVTGEEKGELGSRYFADHPTVPGRIVADINMDMYLPLYALHYLEVQGLDESTLGDDIRTVARAANVEIQADKEPNANRFIRSDQYSFIKKGVPALAFKFGWVPGSPEERIFKDWYRDRYHAVSDDLNQPVDLAAAAQFNEILLALIRKVADAPQSPKWKPDSFFRRFAVEK